MTDIFKSSPTWTQEVKSRLRATLPDGSYNPYETPIYVGGKVTAFAGNTNVANISLTDLTGGIASSPSQNDIVIVAYGCASITNIDLSITGYTELFDIYADDTIDSNLIISWKVMGATPDTTFERSGTGSVDNAGGIVVHVWRNIDTTTPIDVTSTTALLINSILADPPAITPVTQGAIILVAGFGGHQRGANFTYGASYLSNFLTAGADDVNDSTIGMGSIAWSGSGAYNPAAWTFSGTTATTYSATSATIALRPALKAAETFDYRNNYDTNFEKSTTSGKLFDTDIISTFSLTYTTSSGTLYQGGILAPNGDIHFIPRDARVGQKISPAGTVSTYSLTFTTVGAYFGGVLAPNGDIHFVPRDSIRGQKINASGTPSTYALVYSATTSAYWGGVVSLNGDVHFVPSSAPVGQKISSTGTVSTYSLVYTTSNAYAGGVLGLDGFIYFVPLSAVVGQKIAANNAVYTYPLVYTTSTAYAGGVVSPNGDINFVPYSANLGQKVSANGTVSTYSLVYTTTNAYQGGVLSPNGDIHFVPLSAAVGQKISPSGTVSTYSLAITTSFAYAGGVLSPNGDVYFIPNLATRGQRIHVLPGRSLKSLPFHYFLNKF